MLDRLAAIDSPCGAASGLPVLERVPLLEKQLDDYTDIVGPETIERIRELARPLEGKRVLHINATAYGGGVAELLATHVPLLRSLGIDAEWQVMHGSDEFFAVTKQVHNGLQGADIEWTAAMQRIYLEKVLDNSLLLDGFDYVVIHDPQPAALLNFLRDDPNLSATTRSGSGVATSTSPRRTRRCGSSSARSSSCTTRRCGRCRSSCPHR